MTLSLSSKWLCSLIIFSQSREYIILISVSRAEIKFCCFRSFFGICRRAYNFCVFLLRALSTFPNISPVSLSSCTQGVDTHAQRVKKIEVINTMFLLFTFFYYWREGNVSLLFQKHQEMRRWLDCSGCTATMLVFNVAAIILLLFLRIL